MKEGERGKRVREGERERKGGGERGEGEKEGESGQATRLSQKGSLVFDLKLLLSVSFPPVGFQAKCIEYCRS